MVLPLVARVRPSRPWLAEVTLGIGHKVASLRARLGVVECSGRSVHCPSFQLVQAMVTGVQEARRLGGGTGERIGTWEMGVLRPEAHSWRAPA